MPPSKTLFHPVSRTSATSTGNFSFLQQQIDRWQKLTQIILPIFPKQGQWQVVYYQHGKLIIAGDNQALISQVRYLQSQFICDLKAISAFADLEQLQVILRTAPKSISKKYTRKKLLSNETQQQLHYAASLVKDEKLKRALALLATERQTSSN